MRLSKIFIAALALVASSLAVYSQERPQNKPPRHIERPSIYELVDEVRNSIGLENKEFDKTYSTYEKYNKSVFGDESTANRPARPQDPPPGMGGRPGGHGGGPVPGGNMDRPRDGGFHGHGDPENSSNRPKSIDMEKLEKTKIKAEEKLCKSMKKIFKKSPEKYDKWLTLREHQLKRLFPTPPPSQKDTTVVRALEEDWGGHINFSDFLLLLKLNGEWKCVAKAHNQNSNTIKG